MAGDASQNLWQRGTAGTSTTSATVAWDSADHWGQWTLSSGGVKIVKDTTAADLPTGYSVAYGLTHTATTAGAICMGQPIESANSYQFAGQTVELDFHAATSASYTGTNTFTAYITYGTGTDEGLNKMAFTVNAGGATGWAGGANATAAVVPLTAVSTIGRFAAVATIPATATEVGVAFCYTPTTADTTDYVAITGVQLVRSPQLAAKVSTTVAYDVQTNPVPFSATAFIRNDSMLEALRQYRYYYQINESAQSGAIQGPGGTYVDTTHCVINFPTPAPMFKAATIQNSAITTSTFKIIPTTTAVALAGTGNSGLILQAGSNAVAPFTTVNGSFITTAETAFTMCALESVNGSGNFGFTAEN